ncbi:MAG: hypothetical protein GY822_02700 [Deltaproteobacteria bacterium]|nr:hypothetical protein [Deltaproteobacteria bacterium]
MNQSNMTAAKNPNLKSSYTFDDVKRPALPCSTFASSSRRASRRHGLHSKYVLSFLSTLVFLLVTGCEGCGVDPLPTPPQQCNPSTQKGCLTDEFCSDEGKCLRFPRCDDDEDCPTTAYQCVFPAEICELRAGFGIECSPETFCEPGFFCSLGLCREIESARQCARRSDCPQGESCDRNTFLCIPEGPCTLSEDYPELACGPQEQCDSLSERCYLECQGECSVATEEDDCGVGSRCDGACRCVQCLSNDDCGPGLLCNIRAGRCESEDLCYTDDDCNLPLICDPATALCQVPPPPCENDFDCEIAEICNRATGICELLGGACVDDRLENADTPATAEPLYPEGIEILLVDDLQLCPDDDDVYALELLPGDNLLARIFDTTPQARATLWLLDSEGETSLRFAEAPPYGNGTVEYVAEVAETVYLRVNALTGATPYELEVAKNPGMPCTKDVFEGTEDNNVVERATPSAQIPTDVTLLAALCANDVDHYTVSLAEGEGLRVNLTFDETRADLDLALYDAATGALIKAESSTFEPEVLVYRSRSAADVVVRVKGFGNDNGSYGILLERLAPFICTDDVAEPDGDLENATLLPLELVLDEERTSCIQDQDVLEVPLENFQRLVVRTQFLDAELDLSLSLRNALGEELRVAPQSSGSRSLVYDAIGTETVFVHIESRFNTQGGYHLDVHRENQAACLPDLAEPNNAPTETTGLAPTQSTAYTMCGFDQDFFRVEGNAGKKLTATASFLHSQADIDVQILNFDGVDILGVSDGIADTEEAQAILPLDSTYFVRVFTLTEDVDTRYELVVTQSSPD